MATAFAVSLGLCWSSHNSHHHHSHPPLAATDVVLHHQRRHRQRRQPVDSPVPTKLCQRLAQDAGRAGVTWHAYLSTQGPNAVNAAIALVKDPGSQRGQRVAQSAAELQGDTIEQARLGVALGKQLSLTEKGTIVNGVGDTPINTIFLRVPRRTDAPKDSADHTCGNWTSSAATGVAQLGHSDKQGGGNGSWNSAHPSRGCSQENLVSTGGAGLLYCFVVN
jgi:hypothetical protein